MTLSQIKKLLIETFGIEGDIRHLHGEIDLNYLIKTAESKKYVLKIAHSERTLDNLLLQNELLQHLEKKELPFSLPKVLPDRKGNYLIKPDLEDKTNVYVRLLSWVEGRLFAEVNPHTNELLQSLGAACGHLCLALKDFDHPGAHRNFKWNNSAASWVESSLQTVEAGEKRALVCYFLELFQKQAEPLLPKLRMSVNYNDANDYNVLVTDNLSSPVVGGLIDFGDVVYTHTINEVAIAAAYAIMDKEDPLQAAGEVLRGFHKVFPVTETELRALFPLIAARLMISVTVSAINQQEEPQNEYLQISSKPAWELLKKLRNISPALAHYSFRAICGYEPCPKLPLFLDFASKNTALFAGVVDADLASEPKMVFDLSVGSLMLGNNPNFENSKQFETLIDRLMEDAGVLIGIGKYKEIRPIYTSDAFMEKGNWGPGWRTLHIGLDIFMRANTPVYTPLKARVHSFQFNDADRDYGPAIILEYEVNEDLTFYTLYGHLSLESLEGLYIGKAFDKGQQIGWIGARPVNGNWPPHLHFQIILDMLDYSGDFPGVAYPDQEELWCSLCPNPNELIGIKEEVVGRNFPTGEILTEQRQKHLGPNLSLSYREPLHIQRGYLQYLYNQQGRRFLDTVNNVPHVGHQHPRIVQAAQRQMAVFNSNTRYLHKNLTDYAQMLCATFPEELSVCYFVNSGSEANELAMRLSRAYTGQKDFIVVEVGYHGNTQNCIDISSYKFDSKGGAGKADHIHVVPMPDTFRGSYRKEDPKAGEKYAGHIGKAVENIKKSGRGTAAFICESILSCGGQIVLPPNYLKTAYEQVRKVGGVCIADEVQVGFGRVGDTFWGFELQGVVPDIVTLGKPIGNGHPLGAVVTTKAIARAFDNGMEYFNTFGGNPVSCAIGMEVLKVVKEEQLQENARKTGEFLKDGLNQLAEKYPVIGDVRGHGLFLGFELIEEGSELQPAPEKASYLANRMKSYGILMSTDGFYHNVIKIKPPVIFNRENAGFLLETLEKVLKEDFMR